MLREPVDADGLLLPTARPSQAWSAVTGLRAVAAAAQEAGRALATSDPGVEGWSGSAAQGYREVRAAMTARAADLGEVAERAAEVVHTWLLAADEAVAAMRVARADLLDLQQQERAAAATAGFAPSELEHRLDVAWARWHTARDAYWVAVGDAVARLSVLRDGVRDHPSDLQDQVTGFVSGVWQAFVAQPASTVWGLTGAAFTDRSAWQENVTGLPGAAWSAVTDVVRHPVQAAEQTIDLDAWRHGRYGEGAAALAALLVPKPQWLGEGSEAGLARFLHTAGDADAALPRLQTLDELLAGVDLSRSEHVLLGHTLRRHVAVDDGYLADRLAHGTVEDDLSRGRAPSAASRFADRETAEWAATRTLRANEAQIRDFLASSEVSKGFTWVCDTPVGSVMRRVGAGFELAEGRTVTVVLAKKEGAVYVLTAVVDR